MLQFSFSFLAVISSFNLPVHRAEYSTLDIHMTYLGYILHSR